MTPIFRTVRFTLHLLTAVGLLAALGLCISAILTPAWQTAYYYHLKEYHQHGLWETCIKGGPMGKNLGKPDEWICTFRDPQEDDYRHDHDHRSGFVPTTDEEHEMTDWHNQTLGLLAASIFFGVVGLIFALISAPIDFCHYNGCFRICGIVWLVLHALAGLLAAAAVLLFVRHSYDSKNRFILQITIRYEQELGYSFWNAVTGCIIYAVTWFVALAVVLVTFAKSCIHSYPEIIPFKTKSTHV